MVDDFLPEFGEFRHYLDGLDYNGVVNPADGVFYPGVSLEIPESIRSDVITGIEKAEGRQVKVNTMFLRLSPEGVKAPHQAHTDAIMGQRSMMLYLNREEHQQGGTALVKHESGMDRNPETLEQAQIWERDTNLPHKWEVTGMFHMEQNRACMFDSFLMHRAEPVGGFGDTPENARLVLTAFYDYS